MSAQSRPLRLISNDGKSTPEGLKRELAGYLNNNSIPALTATIDHISGNRITITGQSSADIATLLTATLTPVTPDDLV